MKNLTRFVSSFAALLCGAGFVAAQETPEMPEMPEMPQPTQQHEWLQRLVGEWESEVEIYMVPDQPPMKVKAIERYRPLGGFWVVGEIESLTPEMPFAGVYTLGYDPESEQYVGTWLDSMSSHFWEYKGSVSSTKDSITMKTEGPCPMRPGELTHFTEVTEFKSPDHKVSTTKILVDGEWITNAKVDSRRKGEAFTKKTSN